MYYSKSAALREHVNTLAAVLIQYKSKNLSDLEYTRKISCMVTEAYRLRRRNNGKPFVPATVAEWMNMYLNGPSVCKYYKKEPNQIYVPIKINTGYRDAITTLTMVLETIMGTDTASEYFTNANADPSKKTTTRNKNSQLFDMLTHTKLSEKLDIKKALGIDNFDDLKDYTKVFDEVLPKVVALDSVAAVSIAIAGDSDFGTARSDAITFTDSGNAKTLAVKYTPVFKLVNTNACNIIKIDKKANTTINLQPFLIGGVAVDTYFVMNSAIYKDDKDRLHTLQMVYITDTSEFLYMQDGKTFLANKDLNKLKIVEGYFCYDKISDLTDDMIIADQTANKTLEFLLLGQLDINSTDVATLANFDPAKNAEEIAKYAGMGDRVSEPIGTGISDESAASRGLAYFNRLMKDGTLPIIKEKITKARDARQKYIDYLTIALTLAFVIAEQGVNMGLVRTSSIAEAVVPRLIVSAVTIGGLLATKAFATFQNNEYAKNLLENL
jgi:hypothetical protein